MWITNAVSPIVYIVFAKLTAKKFTAFIVERHFPCFKPATKNKDGYPPAANDADFLEKLQSAKEKPAARNRRGHIVAFNILKPGAYARASCVGGSKHV